MSRLNRSSLLTALLLALVCALAITVRWPLITSNSRYFRDEDDAHHFNRTVEMAKRRSLDPLYFNKPSLHFYLRLPVVAASYLYARSQGEVSSLSEIRTRDPYGISGYAFTASNPTILQWNRFLSVALSVGVVAFAYIICLQMGLRAGYATLAGVITALSPEVLKNSHLIGVDILMALMCLACTSVGLRAIVGPSRGLLILCGVLAGLAGASKYNALPIVLVPLSVWALKDRTRMGLLLVLTTPALGFLIGCPYAILSWSDFIKGVSYEVWHYSVSGHEGHSAEPGIAQALFYLRWLIEDGVGVGAAGLACASSLYFIKRRNLSAIVFLAFPVAYALLMISQKTNFTRNMVVIVPYVAVMAAFGLRRLAHITSLPVITRSVPLVLSILIVAQLTISSSRIVQSQKRADSREEIGEWLAHSRPHEANIAIAGPLQVAPHLFSLSGVDAFNPKEATPASLIQAGYDYMVTRAWEASPLTDPLLIPEKEIVGDLAEQRFPISPAVRIYQLKSSNTGLAFDQAPATLALNTSPERGTPLCASTDEPYCWIMHRTTRVLLNAPAPGAHTVSLSVMTPWEHQEITISTAQGTQLYNGVAGGPYSWSELSFVLPPSTDSVMIYVSHVHSPASRLTGRDSRRLGLAVKAPIFAPSPEGGLSAG